MQFIKQTRALLYSPFKLEIVLKLALAHLLGPLKQKMNSCTQDHPISNKSCKYMIMVSLPKYTQIWSKMQILEGYTEVEGFCLHCARL